MTQFVVNAQPQGEGVFKYLIHSVSYGCNHMRQHVSWVKLGDFLSCDEALLAASGAFPGVDVCKYCCSSPVAIADGSIN